MKSTDALPKQPKRREKINSLLCWGVVDIILACYLFALVAHYRLFDKLIACAHTLSVWLLSYMIIEICHLVRKITLICIWKWAKDPSPTAMVCDLVFIVLIIIPELCVFIWGNTFIYSDDMYLCRHDEVSKGYHIQSLWISSLVIIVYGYICMVGYCVIIIIGCGAFYTYRSWSKHGGS